VSCETRRSCESVAPGVWFSDLPIAKCFLVICLPFLDESWDEWSDDRQLRRWQNDTSYESIAENLWKGCVKGHVARTEKDEKCIQKEEYFLSALSVVHDTQDYSASRLCPSSAARSTAQCFGSWICLCPQVKGWGVTH
jgi:hypothetical protein